MKKSKHLHDVQAEHRFKLKEGGELKNLQELAQKLEHMDHKTFQHHVTETRNDFYNWIHDVIEDEELAKRIRFLKSRLLMRSVINERIKELGGEPEGLAFAEPEYKEVPAAPQIEQKQEVMKHPPVREEETPSHVEEAIGIKHERRKTMKAALLEFLIGLVVGATSMFILAQYVF